MASTFSSSFLYTTPCYITLILVLSSLSSAASTPYSVAPTTPVAAEVVCNATLYPNFCKSLFPPTRKSNVYDYCRFSIRKSLFETKKFMASVDSLLMRRTTLSKNVVQALEDCRQLEQLNLEFLSTTISSINSTRSLPTMEADDMQTLLSAILTNQQTCYEGLQETASPNIVKGTLYAPLSNENKISSVSLALYNRGWVHNKKRGKMQIGRKLLFSDMKIGRDGGLQLKMSSRNQEIFESESKRKLLQTGSDKVVVRDMVVVNPDGSGNFTTINEAVAAAPNRTRIADGYFLIYIKSGVYQEYVDIVKNKRNIMMIGDGINKTIITGNRSVGGGSTTFRSATFTVVGEGFVGINITFRNTAGPSMNQAVAVRSGADFSTFYQCSFEAYQDTLYTHSLRQFYRECDIYGTVDFIFGNAAVVFQKCNIYARLPNPGQANMVTAQGRADPNQNTGTSIQNCTILASPDLASSNGTTRTYLGRPWREYSRTIYSQSFIGSLIHPSGWDPWTGEFLDTLYYAEFNNRGPGSNTSSRIQWPGYRTIDLVNATAFTVSSFILGDDWLPATGIPYRGELL
ncbi:hypothetical protein MKX01_007807 [Papaver californicum]|nr:hypothetical protein MKX01_007807 [Papaver californicum]